MAKDDTKKILEELRQEVRLIKDLAEIISIKVNKLETFQSVVMDQVRHIKDQQSVMNQKLDSHTASLMSIEATLAGYADAYKVNKSNIERLDERLTTAEDQLEIQPSDQLAIQR